MRQYSITAIWAYRRAVSFTINNVHTLSDGIYHANIVPATVNSSYKWLNSYSYLAFNLFTRYQSKQDM